MSVPGEARVAALTALYRLHEAAGLPIPSPDWAAQMLDAVLEAAAPHIAAAERERIAVLADNHEARRACLECGSYATGTATSMRGPCCPADNSFATLIRQEG